MSDKKISQLTALTGANVAADDVLAIVDTNATETKKIRADELFKSLSAGTALLPAIAPAADQNTGIFFPAADTIAFSEGGVESMRIDSSGNVGIGIASPTGKLELRGASPVSLVMSNTNDVGFDTTIATSYSSAESFSITNAGIKILSYGASSVALTLSAGGGRVRVLSSGVPQFYLNNLTSTDQLGFRANTGSAGALEIYTGGTEKMRIDSSGNVGIGTSSPVQKLHIQSAGTTYLHFGNDATGATSADGGDIGFFSGTTDFLIVNREAASLILYTNALERMRIDSSGNVGIGTSSPDANLTVNGAASFAAGTALLPSIARAGDLNTGMWFPAADTIAFSEGGVESMRINSSGNVGIGTSGQVARLSLTGNSATDFSALTLRNENGVDGSTAVLNFEVSSGPQGDSGASAAQIRGIRIGSGTNGALAFWTSNTGTPAERMRIATNGIVTMNAYGAGAATFSAAGVISSVSDETWKNKDGVPVDPDAMLKMLEPGYWYYNDEKAPTFGSDRQLGFYAQNVNAAIGPEAAPVPEEGKPWGYYDRSVLAVAVMSLKNALSTIEELKERIATLENK
jgi:hypothetical protein